MFYLLVQVWNAGRGVYFDVDLRRWVCTAPPHPWLPSSFSRREAMEMVYWFFPPWAVGMAMRAPCVTRQGLMHVAHGVVYSGGVLAAFGVIQYLAGAKTMYWTIPLGCEFFASFPYTNHAAAYFAMVGALAAGLLFHETLRSGRPRPGSRAACLTVSLVLCLAGANLSLSRAGVILAWSLAVFIAGYGLLRGWQVLSPSGRLNMTIVTVVATAILYLTVSELGSAAIRREFVARRSPLKQMVPALTRLNLDLTVRPMVWRAAWEVFKAYPFYGTGGWGFRYVAALHVPKEDAERLATHEGLANVHNDFLQFLSELGVVGMSAMATAAGALLHPILRRGIHRHAAIYTLGCGGLGLVVVFSLIDLPFRCPAILWTWVALLAALPRLAGISPGERRSRA